jgi:hypothetical protein
VKPRLLFASALAGVDGGVLLGRTTTSLCALPFGARVCVRDPAGASRGRWRIASKLRPPTFARTPLAVTRRGAKALAVAWNVIGPETWVRERRKACPPKGVRSSLAACVWPVQPNLSLMS